MSFLASASSSRTWLPILGILEEDPSRSRATLANARNSHQARLYRESKQKRALDSGAVFDVFLYEHPRKGLFAVKKTRRRNPREELQDGRHGMSSSTIVALREIQVGSHAFLQNHSNVVNIFGWDWDDHGTPVLFIAYAEDGTLKDFLHSCPNVTLDQRRIFAMDVACGLHALHMADIAHGDVKLANTLVFPSQRESSSWIVKVSDFSHSVFGISSRRGTTYPGSRLYNAPEVRRRDATIPSDLLPRCESFSYGLLVWELLNNGEPYPDPSWARGSSFQSPDSTDLLVFLDSLRPGELLDWAIRFLFSRCRFGWATSEEYSFTLFHTVFNKTLQDDPRRRSDLQSIAMTLDYCDSADIVQLSRNALITSISVWDFNPWDGEPWASKCQFVREIENLLAGPLQPNHAELHLLLSRCYAEEYGVPADLHKAANHLYEAATFDSLEANWILKLCRQHITADAALVNRWMRMESRTTSQASLSALEQMEDDDDDDRGPDGYIGAIRRFNRRNMACVVANGFTYEASGMSRKYTWASVTQFLDLVKAAGRSLCDTVISVTTFQAATNYMTFLEVAAWFVPSVWSLVRVTALSSALEYGDTSYGSLGEFLFRLLLVAAKAGQRSVTRDIMDGINVARMAGKEVVFDSPTGESPLHYIAMIDAPLSDIQTLIKDLGDLGFDINQPVTARSWIPPIGVELFGTPLQVAIRFRCTRTVTALINAGADVSLAYNETLPPLSLATSLNCYEIVDFLLPLADAASPGSSARAARGLGVPSRKGWYDDLISDFASEYRGQSLISTAGMYLRHYRRRGNGAISWLYNEIDGSPLIEAVSRGQRNLAVLATLIETGFYPRTHATRWKLLEAVLALSKEDPFRNKLLALLFCRREIETAGLLKHFGHLSGSRASSWINGWPDFLIEFPNTVPNAVPEAHKLPILHVLLKRDEGYVILLILSYYRFLADGFVMLKQVDSLGHDPARAAYRRMQMAIHAVLRKTVWTFGKDVSPSWRGRELREVSQKSLDDLAAKRRKKTTPVQPPQGGRQPFRIRLRAPAQEVADRERAAESEVNLETKMARRTFEERIAALIRHNIGNLQVAEAVEDYAVWVLQHEMHRLTKAEELCVLSNILRIEVAEEVSGRILDRSDPANWSAPAAFRQLYARSPLRTESPSQMLIEAYKRLDNTPPRWIPDIRQQTNQTGPEAVLEWFRSARFHDLEPYPN